ncbi:SDR family NAD(P)-dependent oxidoreductase [Beijerinckia sp. L45]|uniref:SDR family NAD(P)-dependent oxidoreductase n=1 Tax=Beijerinckia sp. L45 TaxID=1641855 RepID=UPI00131A8D97|nr:SDR family oxidoreductase [Beijerinckia sp. L45]
MASAAETKASFQGQTVLVTGATRGIGEATAIAFGRAGAHVLVHGRDAVRGERTCSAVRDAGANATLLIADLSDHETTIDLARRALEAANGRIDVLVNNAGGGFHKPSNAVTLEDYDYTFGLNVRAPFFLIAAIAPSMVEHGAGAIINLCAGTAAFGMPGMALFGGAKAALDAMTRSWAAEFGPSGVRVNGIDVGAIETPVNAGIRDVLATMMETVPARRMGLPEDVADAVLFLASPAASYVHGVMLAVDGGFAIS